MPGLVGFTGWIAVGFNDITLTSVGFCSVRYIGNEFGSIYPLIRRACLNVKEGTRPLMRPSGRLVSSDSFDSVCLIERSFS